MISAPLDVDAVRQLAQDDSVMADMDAFYRQLDEQVAAHRPLCWNRGACCHFGRYGHRLFVTPLELATFVRHTNGNIQTPTADKCPYQRDGQCHARSHRPMGCRIFFCESASQAWQAPLTETHLQHLRDRHDQLGLQYAYIEWLDALGRLADAPNPAPVDNSPLNP